MEVNARFLESQGGDMERRLYHLDFLRALMLFVGVFYRSAHADAGGGNYDLVREISETFRMACFFIISGYFSVALLERKGNLSFLKGRLMMIAVPALVCVILLAPFTTEWMSAYYSEVGTGKSFNMFWMQHSWFLFTLLAFTLFLSVIVNVSRSAVEWLSGYMSLGSARILLFIAVVGVCILLNKVLLPSFMWDLPYIHLVGLFILISIKHLPFFVLGVFMFLWRDLYEKFNTRYLMWGAVALLCVGGALLLNFVDGHIQEPGFTLHLWEYLILFYEYFLSVLVAIALVSFSARFLDKDFLIVRIMAQSAYTVYVLHFIFVAFLLMVLQRAGIPMDARMVLAAIIACLGGVLFHYLIVKKSKLVSLLLNGKLNYGVGSTVLNKSAKA